MSSEIIAIGDELLIGQVVNTNAAWLGEQLFALGFPVRHGVTVGDDEAAILAAFGVAMKRSDVIVVTGGLGPTHDDITRAAACKFFETDLVEDPIVLARVAEIFRRRGAQLTPSNRAQALVPRGCAVLPNPVGSAAGMLFERNNASMFILPGVPREMQGIFSETIRPMLAKRNTMGVVSRTLNTIGIAESLLFEKIGPVPDVAANRATLAFLPGQRGVRMRITVEAETQSEANAIADRSEKFIRERASQFIFGTEDETIESVIGDLLRSRNLKFATAESCTGGLIAHLITNIAGSSDYFLRGYVTYANSAKSELLGVPAAVLETHGAVSKEVAEAMARGAREKSGADISVATTGIAGPGGGTAEKPVGLVWIGISDAVETTAHKFIFGTDRIFNKERFAGMALELLRRKLLA